MWATGGSVDYLHSWGGNPQVTLDGVHVRSTARDTVGQVDVRGGTFGRKPGDWFTFALGESAQLNIYGTGFEWQRSPASVEDEMLRGTLADGSPFQFQFTDRSGGTARVSLFDLNCQPVPEPSVLMMLGTSLAMLGTGAYRGRRRRRNDSALHVGG